MGLSVISLLYLRWKRPKMHRPIKVQQQLNKYAACHIAKYYCLHVVVYIFTGPRKKFSMKQQV